MPRITSTQHNTDFLRGMEIIKASGEKERFQKEKLHYSLRRAGAEKTLAGEIVKELGDKIYPDISSEKLHRHTLACLNRRNPVLAARYNLKRAIAELGPTGYPFEKYVAQILEAYGYRTKTGVMVRGKCVSHEVDVVASKEKNHFVIECKYHNSLGIKSDLKVALYVYARFLDLTNTGKGQGHFHQPWLVTNTKCTSQAIQYANCAGLKIVSWRHPRNQSLEYLIEQKGLYPITALPGLSFYAKRKLVENGIFLAGDLARRSPDYLSRLGFKYNQAKSIIDQSKALCFKL